MKGPLLKEKEATNELVPTSRLIISGARNTTSCFKLSIESKNFAYNELKNCFINSVIMTDTRHLDGITLSFSILISNPIPIAAAFRHNRHVCETIARAASKGENVRFLFRCYYKGRV